MRARSPVRVLFVALSVALVAALPGCSHLVVLHDPLSAVEHNDLGVAYESRGHLDLAAKEYGKALRIDPHQTLARINLGNIEGANGRWSRAEKCYRRALDDAATNPDAMNNLAIALLKQGRQLDEARALAERAVAANGARDSIYRATLAQVNAARR